MAHGKSWGDPGEVPACCLSCRLLSGPPAGPPDFALTPTPKLVEQSCLPEWAVEGRQTVGLVAGRRAAGGTLLLSGSVLRGTSGRPGPVTARAASAQRPNCHLCRDKGGTGRMPHAAAQWAVTAAGRWGRAPRSRLTAASSASSHARPTTHGPGSEQPFPSQTASWGTPRMGRS